jgi:hypothetical protein
MEEEEDSRVEAIQVEIGRVAMVYSCLEEYLQEVLMSLVNIDDHAVGYLVYDKLGGGGRAFELLDALVQQKLDPYLPKVFKKEKPHSPPPSIEEWRGLATRLRDVAKRRNDIIHAVYEQWHGDEIGVLQRHSLKGKHMRLLADESESVGVEALSKLVVDMSNLQFDFIEFVKKHILPTLQ